MHIYFSLSLSLSLTHTYTHNVTLQQSRGGGGRQERLSLTMHVINSYPSSLIPIMSQPNREASQNSSGTSDSLYADSDSDTNRATKKSIQSGTLVPVVASLVWFKILHLFSPTGVVMLKSTALVTLSGYAWRGTAVSCMWISVQHLLNLNRIL